MNEEHGSVVGKVINILLGNAWGIGSVLIAISSAIFLHLTSNQQNNQTGLMVLAVILVLVFIFEAVALIARTIWKARSYKSYYYPRADIKADYIILSKEMCYCIEKDGLHFTRKMKIRSLVPSLQGIKDKYFWTGDKKDLPLVKGKNVKRIVPGYEIGIWKYNDILFSAPLEKGKEMELTYSWPIMDDYLTSTAFLSTSTEEPTKELTFEIVLGSRYADAEVILEEFRSIEGARAISASRCSFNDAGGYTWKVPHPKRFRFYRMRWDWQEDAPNIPLVTSLPTTDPEK